MVLKRAKAEMQRAEMEKPAKRNEANFGFDIDRLEAEASSGVPYQHSEGSEDDVDAPISPHKEADIEPEEIHVDLNLTHQLITPDKVSIPDRLMEFDDVETDLTPQQRRMKKKKIQAIESMLARTGQPVLKPNVHLAAALAAEAGSVARAVAMQASRQNTARDQPTSADNSPPRHNGHFHGESDHYHHDNNQLYQPSVSLTPSLV